ncbi:MAG TPA: hypothetical protein VFK54_00225 [Candidatus Limnocylindrales bacterium]|nr:hypothetical protein [Candidatus Limnocylindrales bacterium]
MRGYTALARIDGAAIHVARAAVTTDAFRGERPAELPDPAAATPARPVGARLAELAEIAREQWAITTFYLFDPESWR